MWCPTFPSHIHFLPPMLSCALAIFTRVLLCFAGQILCCLMADFVSLCFCLSMTPSVGVLPQWPSWLLIWHTYWHELPEAVTLKMWQKYCFLPTLKDDRNLFCLSETWGLHILPVVFTFMLYICEAALFVCQELHFLYRSFCFLIFL